MERILSLILCLAVWSPGVFAEAKSDWRDELLTEEGIGLSKEALEKALGGGEVNLPGVEEKFEQLGADDFRVREDARKELLKGGEPVIKWLQDQEPSLDPEVRRRVAEIIGVLESIHRGDRELAVEHAMRSLLLEGEKRTRNTGGLYYEWFGGGEDELGERYRQFEFADLVKRGAKVEDGRLVFPGDGNKDGDQRLILKSKNWSGEETFGRAFQVSARLGGESKGAGAWHLGVSIGKVRALFHPGLDGGVFRFEKIDDNKPLSRSKNMGFTPGDGELQRMLIKVQQIGDGKVRLEVVLEEGGKGKGRFEDSIVVKAEEIGELDQVSLDRSGRNGGKAFFRDFLIRGID